MSKELPYFRFYPSEWLEGNITLENERTQAIFVKICAWYWKKDCRIDLDFINKRLINGKASLKQCLQRLIDSNILKVDDTENVSILFLDEQYNLLTEKRSKLAEAGRKGGKASIKHRLSYKDKDKDKDKEKENIKRKSINPTLEEVKEYCLERNNKVDPDKWFNFYESKGWMIGKNKMKDWKAAVRTWEYNAGNIVVEFNSGPTR